MKGNKRYSNKQTENRNFLLGKEYLVDNYPLFKEVISASGFYMISYITDFDRHFYKLQLRGNIYVSNTGNVLVNKEADLSPYQWAYCIAHCLLHNCLGLWSTKDTTIIQKIVNEIIVTLYLKSFGLVEHPFTDLASFDLPKTDDREYLTELVEFSMRDNDPLTSKYLNLNVAAQNDIDVIYSNSKKYVLSVIEWQNIFKSAIEKSILRSLEESIGYKREGKYIISEAEKARRWFINNYPLLSSLAADFKIIEDGIVCRTEEVSIAAVCEYTKEIFINEFYKHSPEVYKFLIAHELLHVALRHLPRRMGRDPYFWNIACDFVINNWLIEMKIGEPPNIGILYDEDIKGLSVESVYDLIVSNIRKYRKILTLRGQGLGDIIENPRSRALPDNVDYTDLDRIYREHLVRGFLLHEGRGYLPASLIEEIKIASMPPIPWDVELARWFDETFEVHDEYKSYARASRRQYATPDIPRPGVIIEDQEYSNTFGIVFDTSCSLKRHQIAKGLGAIVSYSIARDIKYVRLVYCDAIPYDEGFIRIEDIMEYASIKGRGGTILQPAIDLLIKDSTFPKDAPILVVTDGKCDDLFIPREHAFLILNEDNTITLKKSLKR